MTTPANQRVSYTFDLAGQRSLMIEPGGGRFSYTFDNNGRISRLLNPQGLPTTWAYDNADRVTAKYLANGMRASMTWDDADRLQHLANMKSDGTTTSSFDYAFDKADNRLRVVEASGVRVSWAYDKTYQLLHEQRSGSNNYNVTYTFDPAGNRQVKIDGGVRTTYTVDAANQLLTQKDNTGTTTYTWDNSGNQVTQMVPSGARTTFGWDFENRQSRVLLPAGVPNTMLYNGDGLRVQKQDSAGTTKFIWDEQNILEEANQNDLIQVVYTLEPATYGNLLSQFRGGGSQFFLFDGLGSTDRLADSTGNITDREIVRASGVIQITTGNSVYPFKFVGKEGYYFDPDLVKYSVRARIFDPLTCRFESNDPMMFAAGDSNLYCYVLNNPTNNTDPSGLKIEFSCTKFSGPTPLKCGHALWRIVWSLKGAKAGAIVQQVRLSFDVRDCSDCLNRIAPKGKPMASTWWEAWLYDPNKDYKKLAIKLSLSDLRNAPFQGLNTQSPKKSFGIEGIGTAIFYEGMTEKQLKAKGFEKENKETGAGEILSTTTDPKLGKGSAPALTHSMGVTWNCCKNKSNKSVIKARGCGK
jgi:RHS repeat-associated protein